VITSKFLLAASFFTTLAHVSGWPILCIAACSSHWQCLITTYCYWVR